MSTILAQPGFHSTGHFPSISGDLFNDIEQTEIAFEECTREPHEWQNSPPFFDSADSPVTDEPQRPSDSPGTDSPTAPPSEASFQTAQTSGSIFSIGGFSTIFANAAEASPWQSYLRRNNLIPGAFYEQNWSGRGQHAEFSRREQLPFVDVEFLGQAGTARVDAVTCQRIRLARKTIRCRKPQSREKMAQEIAHLQRLRHAHIIRTIGTYVVQSCNDLHILLYPVAQYNLQSFMDEIQDLSADNEAHPGSKQEESVMFVREAVRSLVYFFHCLASTLSYLHRQEGHVTKHMDIKPANILVRDMSKSTIRHSTRFKVYLADFGIARSYPSASDAETDSPTSFTKVYAAPEVHARDAPRGLKADVFSMGCVFSEILCTYLSPARRNDLADIREGNEDPSFQANSDEIKRYLQDIEESSLATYYCLEAKCYCRVHAEVCIRMLDADPERRPSADILMQELAIWDQSQTVCCDRGRDELEAAVKAPIQSSAAGETSTERECKDGENSMSITGQLHASNCNKSTTGSASISTRDSVMIQHDAPSLNSLPPVVEAMDSNAKSENYNNNQLSTQQEEKIPLKYSSGSKFDYSLIPFGTPNHTSEVSQPLPAIEDANLGVISEESTSDLMISTGNTGGLWPAIESSEWTSLSDFMSDNGPMTAGSEMSSPPSHEQRSEPGSASIISGESNNIPAVYITVADNGPGVSALPVAHPNSATSNPLPAPTFQHRNTRVSATKRRRELKVGDSREHARRVRKLGACIRCRLFKLKCDGGTPCQNCSQCVSTHRLFFQPCSRQDILDATLVRHGNAKFGQQKASFRSYFWNDVLLEPRTIQVRWSLFKNIQVAIPSFTIPCTAFDPYPGDITAEQWQVDGRVTTVELPPFACAEENALTETILEMVESNRQVVEEQTLESITDTLARRTFEEAYRYAWKYDSKMIILALRIRSTAIFCNGWGSIVGAETLGTQEIENATYGHRCGTRPISPALCHQIDVVFLKMMESDEQALLKELKKAIFHPKNPKSWYEIFLAYFVIMWHLKSIHEQAVEFIRCQKQTDAEAKVRFLVRSMVEEWENSAGNLIYHFRFVLRAFLPFQKARNNMDAVRKQSHLDDDAVSYLSTAVNLLDKREWLIGEDPDDKWIRQLFEP